MSDEIPQSMWDRMDRMGEELDLIVTRKHTGPKWERYIYADRPRDGWRCLFVGNGDIYLSCEIAPTLWGTYLVEIFSGLYPIATMGEIDASKALQVAEKMMVAKTGWEFWDEKRRAELGLPPYRS